MLELGRYEEAAEAFAQSRDTLGAPGRAVEQPAVAMAIYKQGYVAYEVASYSEAALVAP